MIDVCSFVGNGEGVEAFASAMDEVESDEEKRCRLCRRRFWKCAKELLNANYLQKMGIIKSDTAGISIRGICIQSSNPSDPPHVLNFEFERHDEDVVISSGRCSCTAGKNGKCKHSVALLTALTITAQVDLETWTCTDDACHWKKPVAAFQKSIAEAILAKRFCHPKQQRDKSATTFPCIPKNQFELSPKYALIISGFSEKAAFVRHLVGRGTCLKEIDTLKPLLLLEVSFLDHVYSSQLTHKVNLRKDQIYWKLHSLEQKLINFFYENISIPSKECAIEMFQKSTLQANSACWFSYRSVQIMGCIAKNIYTYASNRQLNWPEKCQQEFDSDFAGNKVTTAGKQGEICAAELLVKKYAAANVLHKPGFIVSVKFLWLGVSPDTIVFENNEYRLMECKTLKLGKMFKGDKFLAKCKFLTKTRSGYILKKRGKHFYCQIQLGLFICNLSRAELVLYNQKRQCNYYVPVHFDVDYVNNLLYSLGNTYFNHCLPYFLQRRENKENRVHVPYY